MIYSLYISASVLVIFIASAFLRKYMIEPSSHLVHNRRVLKQIRKSSQSHELASLLTKLIDMDGAGSWPPRVNHDDWPGALRPYKDIYLEIIPLLSVDAKHAYDDATNIERRRNYRSSMRKFLAERINTTEVKTVLELAAAGQWNEIPREAYNGFYCCVAVCRHAYRYSLPRPPNLAQDLTHIKLTQVSQSRWAMVPVVKIAQLETIVDFPPELDIPWPYLQQMFGIEADSGNITANVLHNYDMNGERVYKINVSMSKPIRDAEDVFFRVFYDIEELVSQRPKRSMLLAVSLTRLNIN